MTEHIRTYFDMMSRILRQESDWDLMYYLQNINSPEEAMGVIKTLRYKLVDMSYDELTKEMKKHIYHTKEDLLARFEFIIEKQRGYPLWMWEYSDLEDWASSRAVDNGYWHFFLEED